MAKNFNYYSQQQKKGSTLLVGPFCCLKIHAHIVQPGSTIQHTPSYSHAQRSKPLKLRQKEIRSLTPELR